MTRFSQLPVIMLMLSCNLCVFIGSCHKRDSAFERDLLDVNWQEIVDLANGSEVQILMQQGNDAAGKWIDTYLLSSMKILYNIKVNRIQVPLSQLESIIDGKGTTKCELIWINSQQVASMLDRTKLYAPIENLLPAVVEFMRLNMPCLNYPYHSSHSAYVVPWGRSISGESTIPHFLGVLESSDNKPGGLVTLNFMLTPQAQLSKYDPDYWGDLPVICLETSLDKNNLERLKIINSRYGKPPVELLMQCCP